MGTSSSRRPEYTPVRVYLRQQIDYSNEDSRVRVLADTLINLTEYYAAVERLDLKTGERIVFGLVGLISHQPKSEYNITYKFMDEAMGPYKTKCPGFILDLLTPAKTEYGREWRSNCRNRSETKLSLKSGDILEFSEPVNFTDGASCKVFTVREVRGQSVRVEGSGLYPSRYRLTRNLIKSRLLAGSLAINPKVDSNPHVEIEQGPQATQLSLKI